MTTSISSKVVWRKKTESRKKETNNQVNKNQNGQTDKVRDKSDVRWSYKAKWMKKDMRNKKSWNLIYNYVS